MGKPVVVGITGVGHSGSTVLAIALGFHPCIEAVGELHRLPRSGWTRDDKRRCSCGSAIHACPFWCETYDRWTATTGPDALKHYIHLQERFERSQFAWLHVLLESRRPTAAFAAYADMTGALYQAIYDVSAKPVIVDSSKSPMRHYALLRTGSVDLRLIHLVRDGRGVIFSHKQPRKAKVEEGVPHDSEVLPAGFTAREWMSTNLKSEWVARQMGRDRAIQVRYETFVEQPERVLREIGALIGEDLEGVAGALAAGLPIQPGHLMGGNRLRMSRAIVLRADTTWKENLSPRDQQAFWRWAGWLARRYGYRS